MNGLLKYVWILFLLSLHVHASSTVPDAQEEKVKLNKAMESTEFSYTKSEGYVDDLKLTQRPPGQCTIRVATLPAGFGDPKYAGTAITLHVSAERGDFTYSFFGLTDNPNQTTAYELDLHERIAFMMVIGHGTDIIYGKGPNSGCSIKFQPTNTQYVSGELICKNIKDNVDQEQIEEDELEVSDYTLIEQRATFKCLWITQK